MDTEPVPEVYIYRPEIIAAAKDAVRPLYKSKDELDYHNDDHYPETLVEADRLIQLCESHGLAVDRETIELALVGHDIDYDIPESEHPGYSKEQYSTLKYGNILQSLGVEMPKIEKVMKCILFTQAGVHLSDFEVDGVLDESLRTCLIITRRCDIKNLRDSKLEFLSNSVKLYYESRKLHEKAGTKALRWPQFLLKQQEFLDMLLEDDLSLGPFDENKNQECIFTELARKNVAALSSELVMNFSMLYQRHGKKLIQLVPRLGKEEDLEKFAA